MFLSRLNQDQRKSFLALATKMALADGRVAVQEIALLEGLADAFGHDMDVPAEEIFGATNIEPFDTRSSRIITLVGMFVVAYIDESLHIDESAVLQETIVAFEFSDEDVERIQEWAKAEAQQLNDLSAFIEAI
jgi:uncharacterized tellurite resistance protein B-like protein